MRLGYVVVAFVLAGCEFRNGTYFVVDGDEAGIEFDQLEFFLGKDPTGGPLYTPLRSFDPTVGEMPQRLKLTKRTFTETDIQLTPVTTSLTYYLPPDPGNTFAHYALVVASRNGEPVGLGEVEDFNVYDDAAYIYDVPLVPVPVDGSYERWGTEPELPAKACVRWTRIRDGDDAVSTNAVVRQDDLDCDGTPGTHECDDLNYCVVLSGVPCQLRELTCINGDTCDLGTCVEGTPLTDNKKSCAPETCLPDSFCVKNDDCHEDGPAGAFLDCAIKIGLTHTEVKMPVKTLGGGLCFHSYVVAPPVGMRCSMPSIEYPPLGIIGSWSFSVREATNPGETCEFFLTGPLASNPPGENHLVVSVSAGAAAGRRTSFVIGFTSNSQTAGCPKDNPPIDALRGTSNPSCP